MTTFTKWFLLVAVTGTGLFFAEAKGAISLIVQNDRSYLALLIMLLFVVMTIRVGHLSFKADVAKNNEKDDLSKKAELQLGMACKKLREIGHQNLIRQEGSVGHLHPPGN